MVTLNQLKKRLDNKFLLTAREREILDAAYGMLTDNGSDETFDLFWSHYHAVTKKPMTDKERSRKAWRKILITEQRKAYANVTLYARTQTDPQFLNKACNYLSRKTYNDEFREEGLTGSRDMVIEKNYYVQANNEWVDEVAAFYSIQPIEVINMAKTYTAREALTGTLPINETEYKKGLVNYIDRNHVKQTNSKAGKRDSSLHRLWGQMAANLPKS